MASGSSDARVLEQRRCLLLAAIGSTAEKMPSNTTLKKLLNAGLLVTIKAWLDDILASKVGAMDLLLHLLSNIIPLPVTKEMVTTSRLGKTVSSVEKNAICAGPNEAAIKSRIQQVKERWSASVKALKNVSVSSFSTTLAVQSLTLFTYCCFDHRMGILRRNALSKRMLRQPPRRQSRKALHCQVC